MPLVPHKIMQPRAKFHRNLPLVNSLDTVLSVGISHFYSPFTLSEKGIALRSNIDKVPGAIYCKSFSWF